MIPRDFPHAGLRVQPRPTCKWCGQLCRQKGQYTLVDGPLIHMFCGLGHSKAWVKWRHKPLVYRLLRLCHTKRQELLNECEFGSLDDLISHLALRNED